MTDPDIRALADQLEAHASDYVHAAATERLLRQAAATLRDKPESPPDIRAPQGACEMTLTPEQIAELRRLNAERTQGEWTLQGENLDCEIAIAAPTDTVCLVLPDAETTTAHPDAAFIAAIANAADALLSAAEENARLREAHRAISETTEYRNVQTQRDLLNLTKALLDDANRECKELSGLLAEAREHVCSVTCRSYWSPGQPHDPEADHSDLCKRIGAALEPSHEKIQTLQTS